MTYRIPLRIVFYQEGSAWIAHCLELDLIGDGVDRSIAIESLNGAIETQLAWSLDNDDPSLLFSPAPPECEVMFAAGEDVAEGSLRLELESTATSPDYIFELPKLRMYSGPAVVSPTATI